MTRSSRWLVLLAVSSIWIAAPASAVTPDGHMTWGVHASLAPTWFDPAETTGISTPFMVLYALHDALVKPMPGQAMTPSLAESWTVSRDGLTYEFVLRKGARFHNGDPVSAEDVKFPFDRFASFNPGIELVLEAYEAYWRKTPSVKRLVFKSVPDESTRLAMLKRGEADIVYSIRGAPAEELRRTPGLTLKATLGIFVEWISMHDQWDPKSPWADRRVRFPDIDGLYQEQAGELC
jgi:ABC-type transport system substrate-binding protein